MRPHFPIFNYQWLKLVVLLLVAIQIHTASSFFKSFDVTPKQKTYRGALLDMCELRKELPRSQK